MKKEEGPKDKEQNEDEGRVGGRRAGGGGGERGGGGGGGGQKRMNGSSMSCVSGTDLHPSDILKRSMWIQCLFRFSEICTFPVV